MDGTQRLRTLTHDLRPGGDALVIDGPAIVSIDHKSGQIARVRVSAPPETTIKPVRAADRAHGQVRSSANTMAPSD